MMLSKKIIEDFEAYCKKNGIVGKEKEEMFDTLKKNIEKYMYEPGEAIGVVAAQSISEPATQMSIDGGEKVIIKHNDAIRITEIGKFVDAIVKEGQHVDGWDVCDISESNIIVPSINEDEKVEWKRLLAVSRHKAPEKLLRIKTQSGRQITATDSHSFIVREDNRIKAVAGSELAVGRRIPSLRKMHENCLHEINIKSYVGDHYINRKNIPPSIKLDETFGFFVGAYLSEGNATKNYINISNTNDKFISWIHRFANAYGLTYNEYDNFRGFSRGHDIRVNSALVSRLLQQACGTGSKNKRVPEFAFSADESFVGGLLRGYFEGDGSVSEERLVIRASSDSKELLDGISLLLARFGIFTTKKYSKQYWLIIGHKYAEVFRNKIGFESFEKSEKLSKICSAKNKQDYIDVFDGFGDLLSSTAKKLSYPSRYVNSATRRQKIGREALLRQIEIFDVLSKKNNIDIRSELAIMRRMHEADVTWDEITEMKYVSPSSDYVYDFTVEGTETFTTFDGIITHNTMRSYTLASQSDRLRKVTQGLPRLIEIFDARKTFEKTMIIYFKPHYNSKEKAKEIAGKIKGLKLSDIIISDSIDLVNMQIEFELDSDSYKEKVMEMLPKHAKDADISTRGKLIFIKPKKDTIRDLRKLKSKLLKIHTDGIKGIKNVIVIKEGEDWIVQTIGANLKKILLMEEVDIARTITNDIYQVYDVFGIEAARNVILSEAKQTLDDQGLEVDIRHLILLADTMTYDGTIKDIGRYGISGKKSSVLARANFEETKKHLIDASFFGETDKLEGTIENIIVGQLAPIGTGMVKLVVDTEKMKKDSKKK
ncbi:DNA-directed RNA polymerase subunit A'' [archaeon]|nr:DNA-directed RNA polymerase subunit A'' [archaeon]